jgi:chromosome segregation ATPase
MTNIERLEKRIRELKYAIDLMQQDPEYYRKSLGSKEKVEIWLDYRLEEIFAAKEELKIEIEKNKKR